MNETTNIDCFNIACARILVILYESFPVPVNINTVTLEKELHVNGGLPKESMRLASGHRNLLALTLDFLMEEGMVRSRVGEAIGSPAYHGMVLTAEGLSTVSRQPSFAAVGGVIKKTMEQRQQEAFEAAYQEKFSELAKMTGGEEA